MNKKIIEDWFPIESVGEESRKEKTGGSGGKISSLHQWHARRPLSAIRAVVLESLIDLPNDKEKYDEIKQFIEQYCQRKIPENILLKKEKSSLSSQINTESLLNRILTPKVNEIKALDPFSGGGSIPFELFFSGCEVYATDLNPVAIIINKATYEYPSIYFSELKTRFFPILMEYANKINKELNDRCGEIFSNPTNNDSKILFYIWIREFPCLNDRCKMKIPMFKSLILSREPKVALIPISFNENEIQFELGWNLDLKKLSAGFYKKGALTCPKCGTVMPKAQIHEYSKTNQLNDRMIAIYQIDKNGEKNYRLTTKKDMELYQKALKIKVETNPNLKLPDRVLVWRIQSYGINYMKQFFNERQYLVACFLVEKIREKCNELLKKYESDFSKAIILYLTFGLAKILDYNSKFCMTKNDGTTIRPTWTRPGLFMTGMYAESNPLYEKITGGWIKYFNDVETILNLISTHPKYKITKKPEIKQMDAQRIEYKDNFFDLIITDPPYYDSIPYAADSDYFYIWEKTVLKDLFPETFIANSTPKENELVADPNIHGGTKKAKDFYELGLSHAFTEIFRVLKENGIVIVIFANKKMEAWETLIQSFIKSKFVITATWPVPMEGRGKFAASTSASLTSVVLVIARKIKKESQRYFDKKAQAEIIFHVEQRMSEFWHEGIRGADFFMCAIGPALMDYSRYERYLDPSTDEEINVVNYLAFVQNIMIKFALKQITLVMTSEDLDKLTQFYLIWRWAYGLNLLPFDELKKLYQALFIDFNEIEGKIVERQKNKPDYACNTANDRFLEITDDKIKKFHSNNMIDYLQLTCYLWEQGKKELLEEKINDALLKFSDSFWTIAQALYDILPECQEATQLQGLLQRYKKFKPSERIKKTEKEKKQKDLLSYAKTGDSKQTEGEEQEESDSEEDEEEDNK